MFVNVPARSAIEDARVLGRYWYSKDGGGEEDEGDEAEVEAEVVGVARTCCTFLVPAICVRTEGHLIAAERSRRYRDSQAFLSG